MALANTILADIIKERQANRSWEYWKRVGLATAFALGIIFYMTSQAKITGWKWTPSKPVVAVIKIKGTISSNESASADDLIPSLKIAFNNEDVKAVVLAINSPGGSPVEAERINAVIETLRAKTEKPIYAVIDTVGASAAYMIAIRADKIYSGNYSLVGSIGAVVSTWDVHKALEKHDVQHKVYASGDMKAMLNPYIAGNPATDAKVQHLVNGLGKRFLGEVVRLRGKRLQEGVKFDTGEVWDGAEAKALGLVDEIGTMESITALYPEAELRDFSPASSKSPFSFLSLSISSWLKAWAHESMNELKTPSLQ